MRSIIRKGSDISNCTSTFLWSVDRVEKILSVVFYVFWMPTTIRAIIFVLGRGQLAVAESFGKGCTAGRG